MIKHDILTKFKIIIELQLKLENGLINLGIFFNSIRTLTSGAKRNTQVTQLDGNNTNLVSPTPLPKVIVMLL